MNLRFQELLPFYVNGTLQGDEREWMERQLAEHADARDELDACRALQARLAHSLPEVSDTIGLDRVMGRGQERDRVRPACRRRRRRTRSPGAASQISPGISSPFNYAGYRLACINWKSAARREHLAQCSGRGNGAAGSDLGRTHRER